MGLADAGDRDGALCIVGDYWGGCVRLCLASSKETQRSMEQVLEKFVWASTGQVLGSIGHDCFGTMGSKPCYPDCSVPDRNLDSAALGDDLAGSIIPRPGHDQERDGP